MPTSVRAGLRQQNGTAVVSVETRLSAHVPRSLLEGCRGGRGPLSTVSVSVSVPSWHPGHAKASRPEWNPGALEWPDGTLGVTARHAILRWAPMPFVVGFWGTSTASTPDRAVKDVTEPS